MKTPKQFDYDLFRGENGEFFTRLKRTGEVTEVNIEVFRLLRNEAMRMYREQKGIPVYGKKNGKSIVTEYVSILMFDTDDNEDFEASWLVDNEDLEEKILVDMALKEFKLSLTERQLDVLEKCLIGGLPNVQYANENNVDKSAVTYCIKGIRKKAKIFFY